MKTRPYRRTERGFTLVELLVVISIIVVLAAMSFGAAQVVIKKQKNLQTQTTGSALQQAMERYYSEYSKLPDVGMQGDEMQTEGQTGIELLTVLLGKEETGANMQNPRQIPFLNATVSKNKKKGGLVYSSGSSAQVEGLYDAWGNPFNIKIDDDYNDEIIDPIVQGNIVRNKMIIVYSFGPDGKIGDGDEVKSW